MKSIEAEVRDEADPHVARRLSRGRGRGCSHPRWRVHRERASGPSSPGPASRSRAGSAAGTRAGTVAVPDTEPDPDPAPATHARAHATADSGAHPDAAAVLDTGDPVGTDPLDHHRRFP